MAVLLWAFGFGPRRSYVDLAGDELRVRMGWGFRATIPLRSIVGTGRRGYVWWAFGVHAYRKGVWIVNGSGSGMVVLGIEPPAPARVLGIRVKLRGLWVSLEDPDGFLAAISRGTTG
jgi:hypothetical protein